MAKYLTCYQLVKAIKNAIPQGHRRGQAVIDWLVRNGYVEAGESPLGCPPNTVIYRLKDGVRVTREDVPQLAERIK